MNCDPWRENDFEDDDVRSYDTADDALDHDEDSDDDEEYTIDCAECGKSIYDDADQCPYCGNYLIGGHSGERKQPLWITITVILCIYAMLHAYIWPLLFG